MLLFLALVTGGVCAYATDTTYELLTAPKVNDRVVFRVSADGKLYAATDGTFEEIKDTRTYVLSRQRDLTFEKFNPFLYSIQTTESTEKDANFSSIAGLLDALQKMAEQQGGAALGGEPVVIKSSQARRTGQNAALGEVLQTVASSQSSCDGLRHALADLHETMKAPVLDANEFNGWVDASDNRKGVEEVRSKIDATVKALTENVKKMKELDRAIGDKYIEPDLTDPCAVDATTLALIYDTARQLSSSIVAKGQLIADLTALANSLKPYADTANWRSGNPGEYIFLRPEPSMETVKIVALTVKPRTFTVEDGPSLKVTEGTAVGRTLRFRQYALFVPELSGAVIKTDLKFPKYGTKQDGATTTVASAGFDDFPASGAIALNGVCRCWPATFVYPAVQFGLTNSKDYPGFIIGGGLRFTYPRALSVVAGRLYTWYRDLEGLKVGDPVQGTADLESHLQRKSKRASYFGIQYSF